MPVFSGVMGEDIIITINGKEMPVNKFEIKILPPEPTPANLAALEDTVQSYEQSIVDLEYGDNLREIRKRWRKFGIASYCRLCAGARLNGRVDCDVCVLKTSSDRYAFYPCLSYGDMRDSFRELVIAVKKSTRKGLTAALKIRLAAILKRVDERGYELVKR